MNCFLRERKKIIFAGGIYHITQRAPGRELLFIEEPDYLYALHLIKEISNEFNFDMFSFVLMPNHLHLLMKINKENLPLGMKKLFETYAKFFNKKYARKGHVFCGNYRCAICLDDRYLLVASLYIHLNPLKAGIVENPLDYRWSSCKVFVNPMPQKTFLNPDFVLKILDEDINRARQEYGKLLIKTRDIESDDILEHSSALEVFKLKLYNNLKHIFKQSGEKQESTTLFLTETYLEERMEELKKKNRLRTPQDLKARKFLIEQLKSRGFAISEIAKIMSISRQSIYQTLNLTF